MDDPAYQQACQDGTPPPFDLDSDMAILAERVEVLEKQVQVALKGLLRIANTDPMKYARRRGLTYVNAYEALQDEAKSTMMAISDVEQDYYGSESGTEG